MQPWPYVSPSGDRSWVACGLHKQMSVIYLWRGRDTAIWGFQAGDQKLPVKPLQGCKAVECAHCSENGAWFSPFIHHQIFLPHIRGNFPSLQYSLEQHKTDSDWRIDMESQGILFKKEHEAVCYLVEGFNWSGIFFLRLHRSYGRNAWDLETDILIVLLYYAGI